MANLKASQAAVALVVCLLLCSFISIVKAANPEATTLQLSITPSTVEHSSATQSPVVSTLSISLTAGGVGLAGRSVQLYYRAVGDSDWSSGISLTLDGSGNYYDATGFSPELILASPGDYRFKVTYTPSDADTTAYASSESAICAVIITPHVLESTQVQLSITPSTVEHSSALQTATKSTLSISLTKDDGTGLAGRSVLLSFRLVGTSLWTTSSPLFLDGSGNWYDANFDLQSILSGVCGHYQFKATYTPADRDTTDYLASESAICDVMFNPASKDTTTVTISGNHANADFSQSTNIVASINGASLANGRQFTVNTIKYGSNQPSSTTHLFGAGNNYYDVQVLPVTGTVDPDVMVTVHITDSSFTSVNSVAYWTGSTWQTVASTFIAPNTISFTIQASLLTGTEIVVNGASLTVTPETPIGAILSIIACLIAFTVYKANKGLHPNFKLHHF
jgi:hypothetical protein